jgi:predicted dithiol-disulfide oxidoreductase (DUF899 family)
MMGLSFPGESEEYRDARNRLLEREIELRRLTEEVARARRALPPGGLVAEDYVFHGDGPVRLSELFEPGTNTLVLYSYMFGPEKKSPCPMCTPLLDGLDAVNDHLRQRLSFAVVAESPPERLRSWVQQRRWNLRLLSSAGNSYNRDYHGVSDGGDSTMLNVFHREAGRIRHFWGTELAHGPSDSGQDNRGLDFLNPIFAMFDVTPEGRGDWYTKVTYDF